MNGFPHILHREFIYLWCYFDIQFGQIFRYWIIGAAVGSFIPVFAGDGIHGLFRRMQGKAWGVLP